MSWVLYIQNLYTDINQIGRICFWQRELELISFQVYLATSAMATLFYVFMLWT